MAREPNPNLAMLELAVAYLGPLADEMVFLGGCATGLLVTDPAAPPVRATVDVDVIVEVASLVAYHDLGDRLRDQGFREDTSDDAPLCRWIRHQLRLDVMPTSEQILGFANPWYAEALRTAQPVALPSGQHIRLVSAPCFAATKLAAFTGRGQGDYLASHDMEDLVAVLDGRPELAREVAQSTQELRRDLARQFAGLLEDNAFRAALPGHLPGDPASQARVALIIRRMAQIAQIAA